MPVVKAEANDKQSRVWLAERQLETRQHLDKGLVIRRFKFGVTRIDDERLLWSDRLDDFRTPKFPVYRTMNFIHLENVGNVIRYFTIRLPPYEVVSEVVTIKLLGLSMRESINHNKAGMAGCSFEAEIVVSCKNLGAWLSCRPARDLSQESLMYGQICCFFYEPTLVDDDCFSVSDKIGNVLRRMELSRKLALRQRASMLPPSDGVA